MKNFKPQNFLKKYNQYLFFYNGYLSNWDDTPFLDPRSTVLYNCSEQYMMQKKALLFNDFDIAKKIMTKTDPGDQKSLGKKVKNFDKQIWNKHARQIVYEGCFYKFTQNEDAYEYLLKTKNYYLVEASPYDTIWGIGRDSSERGIEDPKYWRGTNWLGQVLTQLREDLYYK